MGNKAHYWVGIDEAGYGPNLGPLVMTAIVSRSKNEKEPDLWNDLGFVERCSGTHSRDALKLLVDDSKKVMGLTEGRSHLEKAFYSIAHTLKVNLRRADLDQAIFEVFGQGSIGGDELCRWKDPGDDDFWTSRHFDLPRLKCPRWEVVAAGVFVMGPMQFNQLLSQTNNKSVVHGKLFQEILRWLADVMPPEGRMKVTSDKHGGRHFYAPLLSESFPDLWIQKCCENRNLSSYHLEAKQMTYDFEFRPRADSENGLVALASMVSKLVRERWMDQFNLWFGRRVPGLKPTAGYPMDAKRFLKDVLKYCEGQNLSPECWWRRK